MPNIKISALRWAPPKVQGLVRDFRVRWALEELGIPYEEKVLTIDETASDSYLSTHPFGTVPIYEEDGLVLFESGAIVLHVAEKSELLLPHDPVARERARCWCFAALNTVEFAVLQFAQIEFFNSEEEWAKLRRPEILERLRDKLSDLSRYLSDREYLEETFTVGDLLMSSVLRILRDTKVLDEFPALGAYRERCEARPAFQRAVARQMQIFKESEADGSPGYLKSPSRR